MECLVCLQPLLEPKLLHCGHSFCARCCWTMAELRLANGHCELSVKCPFCRATTTITDGTFVTNFELKNLAEKMGKLEENTSKRCWKCDQETCDSKSCECGPVTIGPNNLKPEQMPEVEKFCLEVVKNAVTETDAREGIKEQLKKNFEGSNWNCLMLGRDGGECSAEEGQNTVFAWIEVSPIYLIIYQMASSDSCWKCGSSLCNGTECCLTMESIDVFQNIMSESQFQEAKEKALSLLKSENRPIDIASKLKDHFNDKYGRYWLAHIGAKLHECDWSINAEHYAYFKVGQINICLYKAPLNDPVDCWKCGKNECNKLSCEFGDPTIHVSFMDETRTQEAVDVSLEALRNKEQGTEVAMYITSHFNEKYGPWWQCVIYTTEDRGIAYYIEERLRHYTVIQISHVIIALFKAPDQPTGKKNKLRRLFRSFLLRDWDTKLWKADDRNN